MANNPEMAFLASSRRLGELQGEGFDLSGEPEITHAFHTSGDHVALRKALQELGFRVAELTDMPGLQARRSEPLTIGNLRKEVDRLCRMADKYAAEYDGWDLTARLNRSDECS